jgi:hypothetical protein
LLGPRVSAFILRSRRRRRLEGLRPRMTQKGE